MLMRFKAGAFAPGLPVQPLLVKYSSSSGLDTTSWTYNGPSFFTITWLTLCNLWTRIEVKRLPAYHPNEAEKQDARLYADNVREYVSVKSGIPTSPFIYDDVYFFGLAKSLAIPRTPVCIKLLKIAHKTALEREGSQRQEMTAQTLRGLRSEDGNLLFAKGDDAKAVHKEITLTVLREMTCHMRRRITQAPDSLPSLDEAIALTLEASGSRNLTSKSNAMHELRECLEGVEPRAGLLVAAILCDLSLPFLWDRVRQCTDLLSTATRTSLSESAIDSLLWGLLGVRGKPVQWVKQRSEEVSFAFLRKNLRSIYPRAVDEAIA